jgi:predicted ATPase
VLLAEQLQIPADERAGFLAAARGELMPERDASPAAATRPSSREARAASPQHNLPIQLTSFVGRTDELATTRTMLSEARLLTLTGPGGSGKTRLALELAGTVLDQFPDGVWLVELAPLAEQALIVPAIAAVLQVREDPGRPLLTTLTTYLRERQPLLLLDNCEHLIDACAQVATTLLQACPRLRILATSREPLGVAGEVFFRVPTLATPDPHQLPPLDQVLGYPAVQLFVERARTVQSAFEVTKTNAPPLAQVCARLDGIPLAIELAAARVRMLPLAKIAARLDDRFHLLTGGSRTAVPRQQTLQALIDWSYELLPEEERALLRRLAVFVGGWTLEAAETVCADEDRGWKMEDRRPLHLPSSILHPLFSIYSGTWSTSRWSRRSRARRRRATACSRRSASTRWRS